MAEHRYPRRWKYRDGSYGFYEQRDDGGVIYYNFGAGDYYKQNYSPEEHFKHFAEKCVETFDHLPSPEKQAEPVVEFSQRAFMSYRAELERQLNEAWMRLDYKTADRIAKLIGVPSPVDHELADL